MTNRDRVLARVWGTVQDYTHRLRSLKCRQTVALFGAVLISFSVGTSTSMGNHVVYFVSYLRERGAKQSQIGYADTSIMLLFGLFVTGFTSVPCGMITNKLGGWQSAAVGCFLYTFSFALGLVSIQYYFPLYYLVIVIACFGVTLGTIGSLTEALKWIPRWEGAVNGVTYGAFAAAPALVNPVVTRLVNPHNKSPDYAPNPDTADSEKYFTDPDVLDAVPQVYLFAILALTVIQVVGVACLARWPCLGDGQEDEETRSIISDTASQRTGNSAAGKSLTVRETLSTGIFWNIYFLFSCTLAPVLTALLLYKVYGQTFIKDDHFLAQVGGSLGVAKGLGAFSWGIAADFVYLEGLIIALTVALALTTAVLPVCSLYGKSAFLFLFVVLFLAGGGVFSVFPVVLVRYFGREDFATKYGIGLTIIAVAALIIGVVYFGLGTFFSSWTMVWLGLAVVAGLAVVLAVYLHLRDYRGLRREGEEGEETMQPTSAGDSPGGPSGSSKLGTADERTDRESSRATDRSDEGDKPYEE